MKYLLLLLSLFILSCQNTPESTSIQESNPAAPGFNLEGSDEKAIELADQVMEAMGGRNAWDNAEELTWNFFGSRKHTWNKLDKTVHIEGIKDSFDIQMSLEDKSGRVVLKGQDLAETDSLGKYLQKGYEMWVNDSYWLFMPFKLKDSGVTLNYLGSKDLNDSLSVEQVALTFKEVGVTPQNKYVVSIDPSTNLICQWDFYPTAADTIARFSTPWVDYKDFQGLLLSGSRGKGYTIGDISVKMKEAL